jgi:hypothetical protein
MSEYYRTCVDPDLYALWVKLKSRDCYLPRPRFEEYDLLSMSEVEHFAVINRGSLRPCDACGKMECPRAEAICMIDRLMKSVPKPRTDWLGRLVCKIFDHPWYVTKNWCADGIRYQWCERCGGWAGERG